ncbi:MAG: two-component sensor histidine kinase [Symploca sp. SIO1C4]|uniref:histidine kinase n=1 Tax=Symploca sp. SIO1C4 TaxID=2607765 RepID=A0A6B3NLZ8_9CYAN|nr:two-component sensor histidine kinase [Symploca sp. SIO1C4]
MAKPGQSSFRRVLLTRLLLLSVPVLLVGVYMTYRKARTALLDTARKNLTESAASKAQIIQTSIASLNTNLAIASKNVVLQSQSQKAHQRFINQLSRQLPTEVECVQLLELKTQKPVASTCGNQVLASNKTTQWPQQQSQSLWDPSQIYITSVQPPTINSSQSSPLNQLRLFLSAPVYDQDSQLRYSLNIQSALLKANPETPKDSKPLSGYPVVINEEGTILAHPDLERVGSNIEQEPGVSQLQNLVRNAIAGQRYFQHIPEFENDTSESIAGYSAIDSPITAQAGQKWVILAVTDIDNALANLEQIQQALYSLGFVIIVANFLVTVYVARDLARPLEKLRDYALNESHLHSIDRIPHNFKVREINQLSEALDGMIERLRDWAEELETAWKEAQTANQLKNEFLASTSHELRTPLNGIIGCLRLVRDGFCDDREEEIDFLHRADDAAIHLLGIINDVLDIAKIEAGKLSVETEPINMRKILDEVINLQAVPIKQKGLDFHTTDIHELIPVHADPAKLKQVLLNVVGNAVKFTDSGSIMIRTQIESAAPSNSVSNNAEDDPQEIVLEEEKPTDNSVNGKELQDSLHQISVEDSNGNNGSGATVNDPVFTPSRLIVTVKDTGIGIDPSQQHKLFRPFVMVDGSTTRKHGGTGLGLAISRSLIEMMGGTISLFSEGKNKGTTITISLPMIEPSLLLSGESQKLGAANSDVAEGLDTDNNSQSKSGSSQIKPSLETDKLSHI